MTGNVVGGSIDGARLPIPSRNAEWASEREGIPLAIAMPIESTDRYEVYLWDGWSRWRLDSSNGRVVRDVDRR